MYLSRLILNPHSRQVQREIADPYEMHRTILHAFPEHLPDAERVLFRLEIQSHTGFSTLLVQSQAKPDWAFLLTPERNYLLPEVELPLGEENPAVKIVDIQLSVGQVLAFRLRANPTVKKDRPDNKQGRRVGLYREEDQLKWLQRKIEMAGGELLSARTAYEACLSGKLFREDKRHDLRFLSVQFDGRLAVKEPDRLEEAIQAGVGPGKGFGFGLLSLAPSRG